MKTLLFCLIALIAVITFENSVSAGGKRRLTDTTESIRIGDDVPELQAKAVVADLKYLESLNFKNSYPELVRILKLETASSSQLQNWLASRVQYVVSESFDLEKSMSIESSYHRYENSDAEPTIEKSQKEIKPGGNVKTVMSNIGAAIYYAGKSSKSLLGAEVKGWDTLRITSPRSGLIQIGEGLFVPMSSKNTDITTDPHRISRLTTFFHEARHSDGNGKSLGFFHAVCPAGHDYEGYSACDRNLNGPYTVGTLVIGALIESCTSCSVAEKEELKLRQLDSASRVIKSTRQMKNNLIALETKKLCAELTRLNERFGTSIPDSCKNLPSDDSPESRYEDIPSLEWDDQPEGSR